MPEFQNDYLHLIIDEAMGLMYSEWLRKPSSKEYREAARIFAYYLREKTIRYWIQDTNHLAKVSEEDLLHLLQELVPIAAASPLKKLARITTDEENIATFMALADKSAVLLNTAIEVQQFKTYREAVEWIEE